MSWTREGGQGLSAGLAQGELARPDTVSVWPRGACLYRTLRGERSHTGTSFLAAQADRKRAASSVCKVLPAAIANLHVLQGVAPPRGGFLTEAVKRRAAKICPQPKPEPLSPEDLRNYFVSREWTGTVKNIRDGCMLVIGMEGMMRGSEVTRLRDSDVWVEETAEGPVLFLYIWKSKTDQGERGHTIVLAGKPGSPICPVAWVARWRGVRGESDWFFHALNRSGVPKCRANRTELARATMNHVVKGCAAALGRDPSGYGSHSCRRGGCTAAFAAGVEERLIRRHGRWRSSCVFLYVVDSPKARLSVSDSIVGGRGLHN